MTGYEDADAARRRVRLPEHDGSAPLLNIGAFSRYAGLSVRMLRHYDDRGVLIPAVVDPFTGYRRYTVEQLRIAGRIRSLRDAGCGIALIMELLPLYEESPAVLRDRLDVHIAGLEEAARQLAAQRDLALTLAADLGSTGSVVSERLFPSARVLQLRRTVACYPAEGELWADLRTLMASAAGVEPSGFGDLVGATYFDEEYRDEDVEMAIWRDYRGAFTPQGGFEVVDLPAQRVAWTIHHGGFDGIHRATESIGAWIATQGRTQVGPLFNVYVVGPGREADPDKWVTEVNVPIG
ncbi:MerR family DNA-binding transcriptional regulator [Microbacterium sp. NPDC012755]|uniref:MerR family transcriptional regulator n=1 Tax=Microbacterium sp. NPDC012755 TaxID=3364184 RepID=UPI0036AB86B1